MEEKKAEKSQAAGGKMKHFKYFPKLEYDGQIVTDLFKRSVIQNKVKNITSNYSDVIVPDEKRPDVLSHEYYGSSDHTWLFFYANDIFDPLNDWVKSTNDFNEYLLSKYDTQIPQRIFKSLGKIQNVWLVSNTVDAVLNFAVNRNTPIKIGDTIKHPYRDEFRKVKAIGTGNEFTVQGTFSTPFPTSPSELQYCQVLSDVRSYWSKNPKLQIDYKTWADNESLSLSDPLRKDYEVKTIYEYEVELNEEKRRIQLIEKTQAINLQNQLIRLFR